MIKRLFMVAIAAVITANAAAAQWVHTAGTADSEIQVAVETVKRVGTKRTFWQRQIWTSPQVMGGKQYDNQLSKVSIDCAADTLEATSISWKMGDMQVDSLDKSSLIDIQPDSVSEATEKAVCK